MQTRKPTSTPIEIGHWDFESDGRTQRTSVAADDLFVLIERVITSQSGEMASVAFMPFERGEELDRLIAALQQARGH
jgi:hypothetical protein